MTVITSIQAGAWHSTATWDTSTVPTVSDTVRIKHDVVIDHPNDPPNNIVYANTVYIDDGSLTVADTVNYTDQIPVSFNHVYLTRLLNDGRRVRLDGLRFLAVTPSLSCVKPGDDGFPATPTIEESPSVIFSDPGYFGAGSKLQDITPEGCGRAHVRKVANNVRYMTVTLRIDGKRPYILGSLYRMAEGPFQVLLVTNTCLIKGHIETIAPDPSSVGTEFISVRVTVAEG